MNTLSSLAVAPGMVAPQPDLVTERAGYFVAGDGSPVVMLHSSLGSKSQWTALAQRLASRYRVIALDLCGYGDNAVPVAGVPFTLDEEVRLVAHRLDRLVEPDERVHLIGHSYGGLVALRIAQCRSERVASLSLYEPVAFRMLEDEDETLAGARRLAEQVARLVAENRRVDAAQAFVDFWSGDGSYASLPLPARMKLARRVDKLPLDFQAASGWPRGPADLDAIVAPTLLLTGKHSPEVVRRVHTLLSRALPNRRVGSLSAGHMAPIADAHRVNPWFEAFVDVCAGGDAARVASRTAVAPASRISAAS